MRCGNDEDGLVYYCSSTKYIYNSKVKEHVLKEMTENIKQCRERTWDIQSAIEETKENIDSLYQDSIHSTLQQTIKSIQDLKDNN